MSLVNDALKIVSEQIDDGSGPGVEYFENTQPLTSKKSGVGPLFTLLLMGAVVGPAVALVMKPPHWLLSAVADEPPLTQPIVIKPIDAPAPPAKLVPPVATPAPAAAAIVEEKPRLAVGTIPAAAPVAPVAPVPPVTPPPVVTPEAKVEVAAPVEPKVAPPAVEVAKPEPVKPLVIAGKEYVGSVEVGPNTLTVSGIAASRHTQVAIVNGATVQAGQKIGDIDVLAIDPQKLTLQYGEATFYLRLP